MSNHQDELKSVPDEKNHSSRPTAVHTPKEKTIRLSTALSIMFLIGVLSYILGTRINTFDQIVAAIQGRATSSNPSTVNTALVGEVYDILKQKYDGTIDGAKVSEGAARGVVAGVGDKYTTYFSAEEAKQFDNELNGELSGIGAEIGVRAGYPVILRTFEGTPALQAGLKKGDIIYGVNDQSSKGWDASDTASKIRGEQGTTVKLVIKSVGEDKTREVSIKRAKVTISAVESSVKDGVGYIKLSRFDEKASSEVQMAAQNLKNQNVKGIILDLRGNGGGLLTAAQQISNLWLPAGKTIVSQRTGGKETEKLKAEGSDHILQGVKTVLLVDNDSASASEIVAGALKDYNAATLVGVKTYGKGTVQQLVNLSNGGKLKVTIARWYTPNGVNITKEGIEVNEKVERTVDDINADRDPQLDKALTMF